MNKKLLLIDDDTDEKEILSAALKFCMPHMELVYCDSAQEGLLQLNEMKPEFIFVDMNMPGMNGITCIEMIRIKKGFATVPLVLYSVGLEEKLCAEAIKKGATHCLKKTANTNELRIALKTMLGTQLKTSLPERQVTAVQTIKDKPIMTC